jgi:hypothetical protein
VAAANEALIERVDLLDNEIATITTEVRALAQEVRDRQKAPTPTVVAPAPRPSLAMAIGMHSGGGWDAHRDGIGFLAREVGATANLDASAEPVRLSEARNIGVLYLSGNAALVLSDADVEAIARVLDSGGVVIGEGCAAGPTGESGAREFAVSFVGVAERLGRQLMKVDRGHALLTARHVFGEPPTGARTSALVMEASGLVLCDADYGCAWRGGPMNRALPRSAIRDALEFGVNLAVFRRNGS